ncbi:MAG TPA: ubiquinol-cytochrome C chaperone family protein [Sphingomicrobium sp.]|nr:ubiquinol-cytochrome C chaperone family protein [Sphingomicrobium sp.]
MFAGLTTGPARGAELFEAAVAEARQPHWFIDGQVPDTLDGRFAVLAAIAALVTVRLERGGDEGRAGAVALAERFVEAMDSEHREMGIGDPALGKKVRKLMASLAGRVDRLRAGGAGGGNGDFYEGLVESFYPGAGPPAAEAADHVARELGALWSKLERADDSAVAAGGWR